MSHDDSNRMKSEVYKNIVYANVQRDVSKVIGRNFIMQQDNVPKHTTNTTKDFVREKKLKVLDCPSQSPDLNTIYHAFCLLKRKLKRKHPRNKQQWKEAAVKAWKCITKEERNSLVMSMGCRLDAVIASKGYATRNVLLITFIYLNTLSSSTFAHLKIVCKYQKIKAEFFSRVHLFISTPNVFSVLKKPRDWLCCSNTFGGACIFIVFYYYYCSFCCRCYFLAESTFWKWHNR